MSISQLNVSDLAFLSDIAALLHRGVRMSDVAATRSPDPAIRALAHATSTSESSQIAAIRLCVAESQGDDRRGSGPAGTSVMWAWMVPTPDTDDLAHVGAADFDDHYLRQLADHHRAAIEQSSADVLEGLSSLGRGFAERGIADHTAGLRRIEDLSVA